MEYIKIDKNNIIELGLIAGLIICFIVEVVV